MRVIEVNGVAYVPTAVGGEQDCSGRVARGEMTICGALNKTCAVVPQIYQVRAPIAAVEPKPQEARGAV